MAPETLVHKAREFWPGFNSRADAHRRGASFIHCSPDTASNSGEQCSAVSCAFFCFHYLDTVTVNIRLNLSPQSRARSAAAKSYRLYGNIHLTENGQRVSQRERNTFEYRANDMRSRMVRCQAHQGCTRVRVEVRCPLAHQVRGPQHAVRTRRGSGGFSNQSLLRIASIIRSSAEPIAKPT